MTGNVAYGFFSHHVVDADPAGICRRQSGGAGCFSRHEKLAGFFSFGCATLAAGCGAVACAMLLATGGTVAPVQLQLLPTMIPYVQFTVRLDSLSVFFGLLVSLLAFALSLYSLGYVRGFYGRKSVGVLGAFFNLMLLATTLVVMADNAFFFLIVWEIMAVAAYCLVSFEHEKPEARSAGVLYFVMSHIGTGCLILGFLLLFKDSGGYGFDGFIRWQISAAFRDRNNPDFPVALHLLLRRDAAFLLFLVGFGVKAGIVPLHTWLPAAHPVAPSNVSAFLSGVIIKTGIYEAGYFFISSAPRRCGGV